MKTRIVITLIAAGLLGMAGAAHAGHAYRDGGHYRGYATHHYRPGKHHGHYYRGHRGYHYVPRYRNVDRHGHYRPHYYHHDLYRAHKVVAGAALLGTIIHATSHQPARRVVYVDRSPRRVVRDAGYGDAWYQTDSSGDCFEVRLDDSGYEVWSYVDPGYCR